MRVNLAVIDRLVTNGIDTVFGIPGKQSLPLNETIGKRDEIEFVVARHETAVTHQAWGYAETSGEMAATVVVPGPGDMNAMNGLKNALNDCTPLIHIAIETEPELRGGDAIHETPPDTYENVVKENLLVKNPEATAVTIDQAVSIARTPPKGPVRVGIPKNFLQMDVPLAKSGKFTVQSPAVIPDTVIDDVVSFLAEADSPVVIAGGGIRSAGASADLQRLVEQLGAPVVTTYKGKGLIPDDHELSAGTLSGSASPELLDCLGSADVGLAVGTDLDAHGTRNWTVDLPETLIHVSLDQNDLGTGYDPTVSIVADAGDALLSIEKELADRDVNDARTGNCAANVRAAMRERIQSLLVQEPPLTSVQVLRTIRQKLPRDTIVTVDAGGFRVWALNVFDAYGPRRYVNPGSWATMGTGLPSAIGAQFANPEIPVVALSGDGGLMMCIHELHTVVSEDLPLTVVVLNNDDYAIISEEAGRSYQLAEQEYSWADTPVDFTTVAKGMGMNARQADTPAEIERSLGAALATDEPTLIEVRTDPAEPQASDFMID